MTTVEIDFTPLGQAARTWSNQQDEIFAWFEGPGARNPLALDAPRSLVVRARAGTGKTTTILEGINRAPDQSILLCAFNKRIADELQAKLGNERAAAKTLHSVGFAAVRTVWRNVRVATGSARAWSLAKAVCYDGKGYGYDRDGDAVPDDAVSLVVKLHTKGREMLPHATKGGELFDLAVQFDCTPSEDFLATPGFAKFDTDWVCDKAAKAMDLAGREKPAEDIDFTDMIFLPLRNGWLRPQYDLVVVDEAQDMNMAQLEIAQSILKRGGRMCVVGDDRQCHPDDEMVELTGGVRTPIQDVRVGMEVVSYHECFRGIRTQGRRVLETATRKYTGAMLTVKAGGEGVRVTPNHRLPTRFRDDGRERWALYLMEKDNICRVGCCQFLYDSGFGPTIRARQEDADRLWILDVFDSRSAGRIQETLVALRFGLPERSGLYSKPEVKDAILKAIGDNSLAATECLESFGRKYAYPLYSKGDGKHFGRYVYITEACNLLIGENELRTYDGSRDGGGWEPVRCVDSEYVTDVDVHSLKVETTEGGLALYVAGRILVHNSIYGFRGADSGSIDRLKVELHALELPLTVTYRCGLKIVEEAQKLVPDFEADASVGEGSIRTIRGMQALVVGGTDGMGEDGGTGAQPNDFILSRKNAPLAKVAMAFIRAQKRVRVEGKDIGAGLKLQVVKLRAKGIADLLEKLTDWEIDQVSKFYAMGTELGMAKADDAHDKADTIRVLCEDVVSVEELLARIDGLFADYGKNMIVCSSVHKAKGLEADRVFVLRDTLNAAFGKDQREEQNIVYVAVTRAKEELIWVEGVK